MGQVNLPRPDGMGSTNPFVMWKVCRSEIHQYLWMMYQYLCCCHNSEGRTLWRHVAKWVRWPVRHPKLTCIRLEMAPFLESQMRVGACQPSLFVPSCLGGKWLLWEAYWHREMLTMAMMSNERDEMLQSIDANLFQERLCLNTIRSYWVPHYLRYLRVITKYLVVRLTGTGKYRTSVPIHHNSFKVKVALLTGCPVTARWAAYRTVFLWRLISTEATIQTTLFQWPYHHAFLKAWNTINTVF